MRIGIDACCWSNRRGFGRFTRELVSRMVVDFPAHQFVLIADQQTARECVFPSSADLHVVETREQATKAASADGARGPFDLWRMGRAVARHRFDAFFFPAVYSYFPLLRRVPVAVTFHDAIAEQHPNLIFPGWRSRLMWGLKMRLALFQAHRIVTVSETARSQVASAFALSEQSIKVVTEGPSDSFRRLDDPHVIEESLRKYRLPIDRPLLLCVGGISPHKNLQGLLHGLNRLRENGAADWHMALVGDFMNDSFLGCYKELASLCTRLKLTEQVTFTGYVSNEDLVALYNAAIALIFPSYNEGFGLPAVEAMACGTPVVASRNGALPEVLGCAGIYFDPTDENDIAMTVRKVLEDAALRERLRQQGFLRVGRFSWASAAAKTVALLEEMARDSR